jgi:hypothetical protein
MSIVHEPQLSSKPDVCARNASGDDVVRAIGKYVANFITVTSERHDYRNSSANSAAFDTVHHASLEPGRETVEVDVTGSEIPNDGLELLSVKHEDDADLTIQRVNVAQYDDGVVLATYTVEVS